MLLCREALRGFARPSPKDLAPALPQIPVGAGTSLKHKYTKDGAIGLAIYGDGAANQGASVHPVAVAHSPCPHVPNC